MEYSWVDAGHAAAGRGVYGCLCGGYRCKDNIFMRISAGVL